MIERMWRSWIVVGFGVALSATPSLAIVSNPLPRICSEFPHSDYVFSGKVLSEAKVWPLQLHGEGVTIYRVRVDRVFKGKVPSIARLHTRNDSARGVLSVGQHAIVFAYRQEGRMTFDGSSNSQSGAGVAKVIAQIQSYLAHPPKVATITGRVDGWSNRDMAPAGIRLFLTNGKTRQFTRTDAHGNFFVPVQPGRWSVRIAEPGWASRSGVYTYDSAEHMRLSKGGCADIELETLAPKVRPFGLPAWKRWPANSRHARR